MIIDHAYRKNKNEVIEILTEEESGVQIWVPIAGTVLFLLTRDEKLKKVKEVRVRDLSKE